MQPTGNVTEAPVSLTYRICVASHLPAGWLAAPGVAAWSMGYDAAGRPVTSFLLEVAGQAALLRILDRLPDPGPALLSVEWVRGLTAGQT